MAKTNNLYKRGSIYWYCFTYDKIKYRGSCFTEDAEIAKSIYEEEYKKILLGDYCIKKVPTLQEMFSIWLEHFKNKHSQKHLDTGSIFFNKYLIPAFGKKRLDTIDAEIWNEAFKDFLLDKSEATYNSLIKYFNIIINYAIECKYLKVAHFKPKTVKEQKRARPVVRANQVSEFLKTVKENHRNNEVHIALEFMLFSGMRESEIIHSTWSNLNIEERTYTVAPSNTKKTTKNKRIRIVELSEDLVNLLVAYKKNSKHLTSDLIFHDHSGNAYCHCWLTQALYKIAKHSGTQKLSSHRLRASFITIQHHLNTPMSAIQKLVGHEKLATTSIYLEDDTEQRISAQEKMSKLKTS